MIPGVSKKKRILRTLNNKYIKRCPACGFIEIKKVNKRNKYRVECDCMSISDIGRDNVVYEWNRKSIPFLGFCMRNGL